MNKIILLLILSYFFVACNSKTSVNHINQNNVVTNFIKDVRTLESDSNKNPINAFKNLANDLADKKTILTKDNIESVLNDSKNYSSCVIVVANHTIVRINSLADCQQSGSWKACMPTVAGYIKKGKLNYKANYMNNVIGKPDKQERIAYFFNYDKKESQKKAISYEQGPYSEYYQNGEIKVNGCGYKKFYRYFVSAKDEIYLMEGADLKSKKIKEIPFGYEVDTIKETGNINSVEREWVKIEVELELSPGEEGYYYDEIEDQPSSKLFKGYVNNEFLEKKIDSIKKSGIWTYFYESGIIKKEAFFYLDDHYSKEIEVDSYLDDHCIKEINYDTDGDVVKINEERIDGEVRYVSNTFHKNGKIKDISDGGLFDAVSISFDENGKYVGDWDYSSMKNHFDEINLTKDIRDFHLHDGEKILKEIKTLRSSEDKDEKKIEINTTLIVDSVKSHWESPENLFLIDDLYSSIIIRAEARYDLTDILNEEEMNWVENIDSLQWWVLPLKGIAKKVNVKQNLIYSTKLCGDYGNFYATELDYDPKDISLACLGNPPEIWFKKGPKCIISLDEATQLINANLPTKFQNINNKIVITETTDGWDGYLNWCCPEEDNPLYVNVDEMSIIEYRIPVNVSAQSKVTIGDAKAHIFGVEESMQPSLKRDIDGDGILEVYWTGCQNFWTHNNKTFISNVGDCCGC